MLVSNFRLFQPFEFSSDIYSIMKHTGFTGLIAKWNMTKLRKKKAISNSDFGNIISVDVTKLQEFRLFL